MDTTNSYKELPNNKIATRVATCIIKGNKTELRIYEENLIRKYNIS